MKINKLIKKYKEKQSIAKKVENLPGLIISGLYEEIIQDLEDIKHNFDEIFWNDLSTEQLEEIIKIRKQTQGRLKWCNENMTLQEALDILDIDKNLRTSDAARKRGAIKLIRKKLNEQSN